MLYAVLNVATYGSGLQVGGIYKSYDRALKRWNWLESQEKYNTEDEDSWRIVPIKTMDIKDKPYERNLTSGEWEQF